MKALAVDYDTATHQITRSDGAEAEDWSAVCDRYEGDVHRVRDADVLAGYDALYVCYDEENRPFHFVVAEDAALARAKRRTFLKKLGR